MTELARVEDLGRFRHKTETQFRRLLEKLPAGAYTCDPEGLITYFNAAAVKVWGRAPALNDPVDRFCGSFKLYASDGTPIQHDQCWMALALKTHQEYNGREIVVERPDGSRITAMAHANPIYDDDGKLIGAVNVLVDISDRKRTEDSLAEADRRKDEFLATLSHQLRNPLAPIRMVADIVRSNAGSNARLQWAAGLIERQVGHLGRLVDDLLDLSRIANGELVLTTGPADLRDIVWQAVEMNRSAVDAKRHNLWVDIPEGRFIIDCDSARMVQVVANLLTNAVRHTPRGGTIHIAAAPDNAYVVLRVRDSGAGIAPEALPHVFDLFVPSKHVRAEGGLGIGLNLVKRIVGLHGGEVSAASAGPGQGAEFTVRLPLTARAGTGRRNVAPKADVDAAPNPGRRVLIADDNADAREALAALLQQMGHEVHTAADGDEALRLAFDLLPEVLVLDIGLPGHDGHELARRLRADGRFKNALLIAHSGYGQNRHRDASFAAGFDHHLVKPIDPDALRRLLVAPPAAHS